MGRSTPLHKDFRRNGLLGQGRSPTCRLEAWSACETLPWPARLGMYGLARLAPERTPLAPLPPATRLAMRHQTPGAASGGFRSPRAVGASGPAHCPVSSAGLPKIPGGDRRDQGSGPPTVLRTIAEAAEPATNGFWMRTRRSAARLAGTETPPGLPGTNGLRIVTGCTLTGAGFGVR